MEKRRILFSYENISWNELFCNFFGKIVVFTKFLSKKCSVLCEKEFPVISTPTVRKFQNVPSHFFCKNSVKLTFSIKNVYQFDAKSGGKFLNYHTVNSEHCDMLLRSWLIWRSLQYKTWFHENFSKIWSSFKCVDFTYFFSGNMVRDHTLCVLVSWHYLLFSNKSPMSSH